MMKRLNPWIIFAALLATAVIAFGASAQAGHENVPILEDAVSVRAGMCRISAGETMFVAQCEQYAKADGSRYLALYADDKIVVIRKVEADGSIGEVVWSFDG